MVLAGRLVERGLLPAALWVGAARGAPADPPDPCVAPLACAEAAPLDPTGPDYWADWHLATNRVMRGRRASPLYRDTSNRLSTWWVLVAHDRERPYLSEEDASRARTLAWVGSVEGLEALLRQTFERSEELGVVYRIGSSVTGADLQLRPQGGRTRLRYNADPRGARHGDDELLLDDEDGARGEGAPPSARTGLAFRLLDMAPEDDLVDPQLGWVGYVDLRRLGVDGLRLQVTDTAPTSPVVDKGTWSAMVRQGLLPDLDAFGRITGQESRGWAPGQVSAGLSRRLPTEAPWFLRLEASQVLPGLDPLGDAIPEERRVTLVLRSQFRWDLPLAEGVWARPVNEGPGPGRR